MISTTRYRFAVQFDGQSAGVGIERLEHGRVKEFWSIYVPHIDDWMKALCDVLDNETELFDVVFRQPIRRRERYELEQVYKVKQYANFRRLRSCRQLAADAVSRKTTITEVLIDET